MTADISAHTAAAGPAACARTDTPPVRRKALRALLPIVAALLVAFVVAAGYLRLHEPRPSGDLGRWGVSASPAASGPAEDMRGAPNPFRTVPSDLSGPPTRLRVAAIGVDTERVYGPTPDRQLRLITCGGVFDRTLRSYRDNLVVYAVAG